MSQPFTKEMKKAQQQAQKDEQKGKQKAEQDARKRIDQADEAIRQGEKDKLKANEEAIKAEFEQHWTAYMAQEAREEEDRTRKATEATQNTAATRLTNLKDQIKNVINNAMARKLPNEEVLTTRDKWLIVRTDMGKGAFAKIYKAKDPTKKDMVVKITPLKGIDLRYIQRYQASFGILRYLVSHPSPNIVPIREIFATNDKAYVFMDQMEKHDLLQRIKQEGKFPEQHSLNWFRQMAEGLSYLHGIGVAHENLKPDAIMFDAGGRVRIGGLGTAVVWYNMESNEIIKQKGNSKEKFHHHDAPEKHKDDLYDPARADVWSLGCLLVILQTKEWPFEEKSNHQKSIQWKLCYKKTGTILTDKGWLLLTKLFQTEPEQRLNIEQVIEQLDAK